jgi:hypothetical protein
MRKGSLLLVAVLAVVASGCYCATVETGLAPSGDSVSQNWATSFLYGLVPPATVQTAARCPHGVATVQTQHSDVVRYYRVQFEFPTSVVRRNAPAM